ncbi:MAG TPA: hypothetical protein VF171_09925, partial [Trueperaceae bacterium]
AKACHDLDLLRWLIGTPCLRLTSYGGLMHFRPENAPPGATARCTDGCALVRSCPYSAPRIYLERFGARAAWPNTVLTAHPDPGTLARALAEGPYGRCVYHCDNDVADHQVVAFEFEGGVTASLTVSAFTERNTRTLHIMGTHGELHGDMESGEIILQGFGQDGAERIQAGGGLGHREADEALILDFLAQREAARAGAPASDALTALDASIESHVMAFAAEASRRGAGAVELASFLPA